MMVRSGSGVRFLPVTNESGSGRPKNIGVLWIQIRNIDLYSFKTCYLSQPFQPFSTFHTAKLFHKSQACFSSSSLYFHLSISPFLFTYSVHFSFHLLFSLFCLHLCKSFLFYFNLFQLAFHLSFHQSHRSSFFLYIILTTLSYAIVRIFHRI